MKAELIAWTALAPSYIPGGYVPHVRYPDYVDDADELAEIAGRLCYKSWDRPNPKTATNPGYLANIIDQGHFSVLEHASATFYISGVSRSLTHELVRHRHLNFSQVSQRYVDESEAAMVVPPAIRDSKTTAWTNIYDAGAFAREIYTSLVERLMTEGLTRKAARGAARAVLPNMTETEIIVTGNHRAWRDVIAKRISPAADAEIRELAGRLLVELKKIAPSTYQDM